MEITIPSTTQIVVIIAGVIVAGVIGVFFYLKSRGSE
jgi:high-affinity Fe2+/Pb2+ permease